MSKANESSAHKRVDTLDKEFTALTFEAARLVDARDAGDASAAARLEDVRSRLAAVKAQIRCQLPSFDRWEC